MPRFFWALLAVLVSNGTAIGQSRPNYQLLWKISGNGLKEPSYLFGTMHVRDNKAFEFSDSVLLKIDACEAFALEVHPDSVMKGVLTALMTGGLPENQLKKDLPEGEYNYLDSLLQARTGKSLQKFNSYIEVNAFLTEQYSQKDRETFLDAWLYNIARNQDKKILGLEKISDQLSLLEDALSAQTEELKSYLQQDYAEGKKMYQRLLDIYHTGDIDEMEKFARESSTGDFYDDLIPKRNVVMANGIADAVKAHTTFVAVGAAHLGGENGIVRLLQKMGFKLTNVTPTFTGLASRYKLSSTSEKWFAFAAADGGYSIDMPHAPVPLKMPQAPLVFQSALDFGTMTIFMATHLPLQAAMKGKPDELLETMMKSMSARGTVRNSKAIVVDGHQGREFEIANDDHVFRARIIARDPFIYMLMAGSSEATARGEKANRFFSSLTFSEVTFSPGARKAYVHKAGAYSIDMSENVAEQTSTPPDAPRYKINVSFAVDMQTQETFLVRYNDFPPGLVSVNDSLYMDESLQAVANNLGGTNVQIKRSSFNGFPVLRYEFDAREGSAKAMGQAILRGNRFYMTLALRPPGQDSASSASFLTTLKFLPYQQTATQIIRFQEGVSLKVPEKFAEDSTLENTNDTKRYSFLDRNSGITFVLQVESLSPYEQAANASEYFERIGKNFMDEYDSVIREQPIHDRLVGREYWVKSKKANAIKRIRFLLAGDKLISLWGFLPFDYAQSNFPNEIFDSFSVDTQTSWSLFKDKTDLILADITSPDSLTRATARNAIREHPFEVAHLPQLYQALRQAYPHDAEDYTNTRHPLLNVLTKCHDESTREFIEETYQQLPDTTLLRDTALKVLVSMKTEESVRAMMKLMKADAARSFNDYVVLSPFYDSLGLLNPVAEQLIELEPRFGDCYNLFDVLKAALDSGALRDDVRHRVVSNVLAMATRLVGEPLPTRESDSYDEHHSKLVNLAGLLGAVPFSMEMKSILTRLHQAHDPEIMLATAIHLLKNDEPVPAKDLGTIAASPLFRLPLYRNLKEIGHEKLFDKKYFTPKMIAESELYEYIYYEDGVPDQFQFVMEKKVQYSGTRQSVFVFKFNYGDEWYYGLSGPFQSKIDDDLPAGDLTTTFYEPYTNDAELQEELKKYVEENGGVWLK